MQLQTIGWVKRFHQFIVPRAERLVIALPVGIVLGNAVCDPMISIMALLWLFHCAFTRDWSWLHARWIQLALVLWAYMVARSLFVPDIEAAMSRALPWIRFPLAAGALCFWLMRRPGVASAMLKVMIATVLFLLADTWMQYEYGTEIFGMPIQGDPNTGLRLTGPFSGLKVGIVITWLAFPVLTWALMPSDHRGSWKRISIGALLLLGFLGVVFISGERMALILAVCGVLLMGFLLPRGPLTFLIVAAIVLGSTVVLWKIDKVVLERQLHSTAETVARFDESTYGHIWRSGITIGNQNKWFGVGPRHFRYVCPDPQYGYTVNVSYRCNLHPHNIYIEWYAETGLVGLGLFVLLIVSWLYEISRAFPALKSDPVYLGLYITLILRLWPVATMTSFHSNWAVIPFWLFLGWMLSLCDKVNKPRSLHPEPRYKVDA